MLKENARVLALLRFCFDMLCVAFSFICAWYIKFVWNIFPKEAHLPLEDYAVLLYAALIIFAFMQYLSAMYESQRMGEALSEIKICFKNSLIVLAFILAGLFFFKKADISRVFTFVFVMLIFIFTSVQRITIRSSSVEATKLKTQQS